MVEIIHSSKKISYDGYHRYTIDCMRTCLKQLISFLSAIVVSCCYAGSYQIVSITGGSASISSSGGVATVTAYSSGVYDAGVPVQGSGFNISCTGEVTAVFQWVPSPNSPWDVPPSQAIGVKTSYVSLQMSAYSPMVFTGATNLIQLVNFQSVAMIGNLPVSNGSGNQFWLDTSYPYNEITDSPDSTNTLHTTSFKLRP